jgi:hypothetical protein
MYAASPQPLQHSAVCRTLHSRVRLTAFGLLALIFSGCTTVPGPPGFPGARPAQQAVPARPTSAMPVPTPQRAAGTASSFRLRHIPVPGSSPNNSREFPYQPILDEQARPPGFSEANPLAAACSAAAQPVSVTGGPDPAFDAAAFKMLVEAGLEVAKAESDLNFYRLRHETQSRYITRMENERQAYLASLSPQMRAQAEANERSIAQRNRAMEQRGIDALNLTHSEMVARLRSNHDLIQAEQQRIYQLTTEYHARLRQVADRLLADGTRAVSGRSELDGLREFSISYERVIAPCRQRLQYGQTLFVWTEFEDTVTRIAVAAFERNQAALASIIRAANTRSAMQDALTRQVGSSVLVNLAVSVPSVARAAAEQIARFDAAEAEARRQQAAQLAAAQARAARELRAEYQRKEAANTPPTGPEIAELLTTFVIQNSQEARTLGRIERTGARSFDDFFATGPFQDRRRSSNYVEVQDVRCAPSGRRQVCTYSEVFTFRRWRFGFIEVFEAPIKGTGKAEFYWTAAGLQSPELQANTGALVYTFGSGGGPAPDRASRASSNEAIGERARDESEARELRQQEARRAWEQDQESRRQRNRRCGPAPNICN